MLLSIASLIIGSSMLGMIVFSSNFFIISILIFTTNYGFVYINVYSYLYIAENFKGELAGFVTIMYSFVWAMAATLYAIIGLCTDANWRFYCAFTGTLSIVAGVGFLLTKSEMKYETEEHEEHTNANEVIFYKLSIKFSKFSIIFKIFKF